MSPHLGHVHLRVRELDPSVEFYVDIFGLTETERYGRFAFLSFGEHHHDVALQAVGEDAAGSSDGVGLYHAAVELDGRAALGELYGRLHDRGVAVAPVDHGISLALYFDDPSGNGLEAYVDTREDETTQWDGTNVRFDPTAL